MANEQGGEQLKRPSEEIVSCTVAEDYRPIDIVIKVRNIRDFAEREFPGSEVRFEMIYGSRFRRLWGQFREKDEGELPGW